MSRLSSELRCEAGHLRATIENGRLVIVCPQCSHAARKAGKPSPVTHAFALADLLLAQEPDGEPADAAADMAA